MTNFTVYAVGPCFASVCTSLDPDEAAQRLNVEYPTGVGPWSLHDGSFKTGEPNEVSCSDHDGHRHLLFSC